MVLSQRLDLRLAYLLSHGALLRGLAAGCPASSHRHFRFPSFLPGVCLVEVFLVVVAPAQRHSSMSEVPRLEHLAWLMAMGVYIPSDVSCSHFTSFGPARSFSSIISKSIINFSVVVEALNGSAKYRRTIRALQSLFRGLNYYVVIHNRGLRLRHRARC